MRESALPPETPRRVTYRALKREFQLMDLNLRSVIVTTEAAIPELRARGGGALQPAEVEENLGALGWAISEADMANIDAIFARHGAVTVPTGWLEDA